MKIETYEYNGRQVGSIINDVAYVTHRKAKLHMFRGGQKTVRDALSKGTASWGIDQELLYLLKAKGIRVVVVNDTEGKKCYWTTTKRFIEEGKFLNMGHGLQKFLPTTLFNTEKDFDALVGAITKALGK